MPMTTADSSNPGASSQPKPATLIHHGEHDANVLKLQQQLHRLGYPIAADGVFGPQTEAALRDAQAHAGVAPNGIAGPPSMLALGNLEARGYQADAHWAAAHHAPDGHHGHHGHHAGHPAPDLHLGTLPFPDAHHDDPHKPAEDHSAHDPYASDAHHDDPYKPAEDHSAHDPYAAAEVHHEAMYSSGDDHHGVMAPHEDPYASPEEPKDDHD